MAENLEARVRRFFSSRPGRIYTLAEVRAESGVWFWQDGKFVRILLMLEYEGFISVYWHTDPVTGREKSRYTLKTRRTNG